MHKYTLNTATGVIHIYESFHYNPTYGGVGKASSCNGLPGFANAYDLGECVSPQKAGVKARKHHPTMNLRFCEKCFGLDAVFLDAYVQYTYPPRHQ